MVLFYKAITYILKSSYRAKEGLSVGLIHRPALLASQIYRLCTRRRSERFGDNSIISAAMQECWTVLDSFELPRQSSDDLDKTRQDF